MNFRQMLNDFEDYHRNFKNRLWHYAGISTITIGVLGLLSGLELGGKSVAVLLLVLTFGLDLIICPTFALPVLAFGSLFLLAALPFSQAGHIVLFVFGWAFQLIGHRLAEHNRPAFVKNLLHLYVGPRWMIMNWLHPFGIQLIPVSHLKINTDLLDLLRHLLARLLPVLGRTVSGRLIRGLESSPAQQLALRHEYDISKVPVTAYTDELRERIVKLQASLPGSVFITTSGTTSRPKQILYDEERLKIFKMTSLKAGLQIMGHLRVKAPSLFVFSGLKKDDSFASLVVVQENGLPGLKTSLTEPAKYLFIPQLTRVVEAYGANAARILLIVLSDPSLLYATNPSTLAVFLDELNRDWDLVRNMLTDFAEGRGPFDGIATDKTWKKIIAHLATGNYGERIMALTRKSECPGFSCFNPSLKGYICWDGGYVTGFLEKIRRHLPLEHFAHVPMFSMATETLQTQTIVHDGKFFFVPISDHVLYEFFPEDEDARNLLLAHELEQGRSYVMVVSDRWGLRRYNTQDVFLCLSKLGPMPDLRFQKRSGLTYSFTGEKVTAEQVDEALARIERSGSAQFTLVPSRPAEGLPHYVLLLAQVEASPVDAKALAARFDELMGEINGEYREKRRSGRLGAVRVVTAAYDKVVRHFDPKTTTAVDIKFRTWESQFKLTPLTRKLWEDLGLD